MCIHSLYKAVGDQNTQAKLRIKRRITNKPHLAYTLIKGIHDFNAPQAHQVTHALYLTHAGRPGINLMSIKTGSVGAEMVQVMLENSLFYLCTNRRFVCNKLAIRKPLRLRDGRVIKGLDNQFYVKTTPKKDHLTYTLPNTVEMQLTKILILNNTHRLPLTKPSEPQYLQGTQRLTTNII